jgi:hypothetical protein
MKGKDAVPPTKRESRPAPPLATRRAALVVTNDVAPAVIADRRLQPNGPAHRDHPSRN